MGYILSNLAVILAAAAAGLLVGLAYALLRRRSWTLGDALGVLATAAVAEFWLACILAGALILAPTQAGAWTMALGSAVVIWIGFVVPVIAASYRFNRLGAGSAALDAAHWLAAMVAQAATLHLIGLTRP